MICFIFVIFCGANLVVADYVTNLIESDGFPAELHEVETKDGYILKVHRIPSAQTTKPPILLMHGFLASSESFLWLGVKKALGYLLAQRGYDVWMGNVRGVSYSRRHRTMDPDLNKEFWDFSLDEIALNDLPATIDYISNETHGKKIVYLGYSQGSTILALMCTQMKQYCDKLKMFVGMAPAIMIKDMLHPWLPKLYPIRREIQEFLYHNGIYELPPLQMSRAIRVACHFPGAEELCISMAYAYGGIDGPQMDKINRNRIFKNLPEGSSVKQFVHLTQLFNAGVLQKYDYEEDNYLKYSNSQPPHFNLSTIDLPVALYYAKNDWFVNPKNVECISKEFPNVVDTYLIQYDNFTHLDFVMARDAHKLVYFRIIKTIDTFA